MLQKYFTSNNVSGKMFNNKSKTVQNLYNQNDKDNNNIVEDKGDLNFNLINKKDENERENFTLNFTLNEIIESISLNKDKRNFQVYYQNFKKNYLAEIQLSKTEIFQEDTKENRKDIDSNNKFSNEDLICKGSNIEMMALIKILKL